MENLEDGSYHSIIIPAFLWRNSQADSKFLILSTNSVIKPFHNVLYKIFENQLPHIKQSSGASRLQAIASMLSTSSDLFANPFTVWSSFVEASSVN